jgi:hypothetical protein
MPEGFNHISLSIVSLPSFAFPPWTLTHGGWGVKKIGITFIVLSSQHARDFHPCCVFECIAEMFMVSLLYMITSKFVEYLATSTRKAGVGAHHSTYKYNNVTYSKCTSRLRKGYCVYQESHLLIVADLTEIFQVKYRLRSVFVLRRLYLDSKLNHRF